MSSYPFAPRPLSDSLASLMRPRASTGRYHLDVVGLTTSVEAA
ncbi:hypothetical protein L915_03165, partial [Phytophthora nicotianae]